METKTLKLSVGEWGVLLLVVGLLGTAISPGTTQATQEQKLTDLVMRLHEMRAAVALYKADHAGLYPGQRYLGGNIDPDAFVDDLTSTSGLRDKPYLSAILKNPYIADPGAAGRVMMANSARAKPEVTAAAGWWFNAATGKLYACDSEFHAAY